MADVIVKLGGKNQAWVTANASHILEERQHLYILDGANAGHYYIGDGSTVLSGLTLYGGSGSLTVGTTAISGATNGYILYNNNGTLGEKNFTGTGGVVLATSPTISALTVLNGLTVSTYATTGTNGYGAYFNATTGATNNYAIGANTRCLFGNAIVGTWATSSLYAVFRHSSVVDASQYALVQDSSGYTYLNSSVQTNISVASTALLILTANLITVKDSANFAFNTSTGTKLGTATTQKIGFWAATPIVQPTTAVTAATYAAVGGSTVQTSDTFDGYTVGQVVKALRNAGLLA